MPQDKLASLVETIVSNVKAADIVELLKEKDAQMFIDVMDEVMIPILHVREEFPNSQFFL